MLPVATVRCNEKQISGWQFSNVNKTRGAAPGLVLQGANQQGAIKRSRELMNIILDLQKLPISGPEFFFATSCSSSATSCCNPPDLN
jgi:hypothetical protein